MLHFSKATNDKINLIFIKVTRSIENTLARFKRDSSASRSYILRYSNDLFSHQFWLKVQPKLNLDKLLAQALVGVWYLQTGRRFINHFFGFDPVKGNFTEI